MRLKIGSGFGYTNDDGDDGHGGNDDDDVTAIEMMFGTDFSNLIWVLLYLKIVN